MSLSPNLLIKNSASKIVRVIETKKYVEYFSVSPDGKELLITLYDDPKDNPKNFTYDWEYDSYLIKYDWCKYELIKLEMKNSILTPIKRCVRYGTWLPNGKEIIYIDFENKVKASLAKSDVNGANEKYILRNFCFHLHSPCIADDTDRIFFSCVLNEYPEMMIASVDADGSNIKFHTNGNISSCSKKGKKLFIPVLLGKIGPRDLSL